MNWIVKQKIVHKSNNILSLLISQRNLKVDKLYGYSFNDLTPYTNFLNIELFIQLIQKFKNENKKVYIHGDFDVDGVSATALLWRFLYEELKMNVIPFIPNRFTDGYGLSTNSIENIIQQGGEVIITVDCGIKDGEIIKRFSDKIDFIITDHHTLLDQDTMPENQTDYFKFVGTLAIPKYAKCVIHPKISYSLLNSDISGSMVVFQLCRAITERLKLDVNLKKYSIFAMLGTVCDIMELVGDNRIITEIGLDEINHSDIVGIRALLEVSGLSNKKITTYDIGYIIGPRINAAGRLDSAMIALRLLCTNSYFYAIDLAKQLNKLNIERQNQTQKLLDKVEKNLDTTNKFLYAYNHEWPEGILGLVAGKLTEKHNKPIAIGSIINDNVKGSIRSIDGFHITQKLSLLSTHLQRYGGHEKAAGFTLLYSNAEKFFNELTKLANDEITNDMLEKKVYIDLEITPSDINLANYNSIKNLEPFGYGNPKPVFMISNLKINNIQNYSKVTKYEFLSEDLQIHAFSFKNFEISRFANCVDIICYLDIDQYIQSPALQIIDMRASII